MMRAIIFCILLLCSVAWAAPARRAGVAKKSWDESGVFELSLVAAKQQLRAKLKVAGYKEKHEIPLGKKHSQCLILWEKGDEQLIYMLWQIEVDKTGYSLGRTRNVKRK